jgi:UPF0716 protein FxsA
MPFFIIFLIIPLIEIALFIAVGDEIGILSTLLLCVVTAIIGGGLVRYQGLQTLFKAQNNLRTGMLPLTEIFDGFCIVIAGALLLTPGFFTDIIGFSLLVPAFRTFARGFLSKTKHFRQNSTSKPHQSEIIIEGEYETVQKERDNLAKYDD